MTRPTTTVVAVAMAVAMIGAVVFQVGAVTQPADRQVQQIETAAAEMSDESSFEILSVSAPASAAPGENVTVVALVRNSGTNLHAEGVEFRLEGDVVARERLAIDAGDTEAVRFQVDTTGLEPGEYIHSVYSGSDGVNGVLTISESFTVSDLEAPANATVGDTITVNATVSNPNSFNATQDVAFRLDGSPLVEQEITLDPEGSTTFTAEVDTTDVSPGTYAHGVFTRDTGAVDTIDIVSQMDRPESASVSFMDQQSNGTSVTVESVTVPDGGFVVIHDDSLLDGNVVGSVIGVSDSLEPGTHENVTVDLFNVTGAEFNETELTENQTLIAMPHRDTNGDGVYNFVESNGFADGPYTSDGAAVTDSATVTVPQPEPTASVSFVDQETNGTSVTVESATLSDGGFVVIHDESLLDGNVLDSVVGVSAFLDPGTHENITVGIVSDEVFNGTNASENQTLIAMPHLDTNDNEAYDFVTSDGQEDGPYTLNGSAITDPALVTLLNDTETPDNETEPPTDDGGDGEEGDEGDETQEEEGDAAEEADEGGNGEEG